MGWACLGPYAHRRWAMSRWKHGCGLGTIAQSEQLAAAGHFACLRSITHHCQLCNLIHAKLLCMAPVLASLRAEFIPSRMARFMGRASTHKHHT